MPCTIAQNWRLSGNQYHNQIMVLSGKAQTSLILLDLFLLIIGTQTFTVVIWAIWNQRNNLRLGKQTISLVQLLHQAKERQLELSSTPMST